MQGAVFQQVNTFKQLGIVGAILGITALINPISVHSQVLRKELPILTAVTALAAWQVWDGEITRIDALVLLGVFGGLMAWTIRQGMQKKVDPFGSEMARELGVKTMPLRRAVFWLIIGLVLLILSSRMLVWGAVEIARGFGVTDLFNTLAVVGIAGTMAPMAVGPEVFSRDIPVMGALTVSLFVIGYRFRGPGRINRFEGGAFLACYVGYTAFLVRTVFSP
jgi:cation:H+ antiporter